MSGLMILIAGPYRSGTGDDPEKLAANVRAMEAYALPLFRAGHVPVVGEWLALPLVALAGSRAVGDGPFDEIFHPIAERMLRHCDAVLRIGGASQGADEMVRVAGERGLRVFRSLAEVPGCSLHPGLQPGWAECERVRRELLDLLATRPEGWNVRPEGGAWSALHVIDHLLRSEVGTSKMVRRLIRGDFDGLVRPGGAVVHGSSLAAYPYDPSPAPPGLVPDDAPALDRAALDAAHRRLFDELARFAGPDADAPAAPDPATGVWFTLAGWVRLQALHEAHHLEQIRRLLR